MIKNFDNVSKQLRELAGVINAFKSEAVQLRLVELIFKAVEKNDEEPEEKAIKLRADQRSRRKKRATRATAKTNDGAIVKAKTSGRPGGKATLAKLLNEGFFKKPKTIKQLVEHADLNLALKYNQSDFSGALARYVRDGKLKRAKNKDRQYEYSKE